jgi:thymidylate kinase
MTVDESSGRPGRRRSDHPQTLPGRFIALEGPDGIGKTTLAGALGALTYDEAVAALLARPAPEPGWPLVFVSRRQISGTSGYAAKLMEHLSTVLWHSGDSTDLPDSFWVSVQAAWFTAHATNVLEPLLRAGHDVVVDGWLYKFWSKLLLQGYQRHDLETIFAEVRKPDVVVLLSADAGMLYDRQDRGFRASELGMHAGYTELNRASFVTYQEQGMQLLEQLAREHRWPVLTIGAGEPVEETRDRVSALVTAALATVGETTGQDTSAYSQEATA